MTTTFVEDYKDPRPDHDLEWLKANALWVIMDPWYPHPWPHDVQADPKIDERSNEMVGKIVEFVKDVNHVKLSCPDRFPIHPDLTHIENYANETHQPPDTANFKLAQYMVDHDIQDLVYIGFHLGRCILNKESGAKTMLRHRATCWQYDALVGRLITDNEDAMLEETKKWCHII